jgi:hypothetical protein
MARASLAAAVLLLVLASAEAARTLKAPGKNFVHRDFRALGGSMKALGRMKLGQLKRKAKLDMTVEQLAATLDTDADLVSRALTARGRGRHVRSLVARQLVPAAPAHHLVPAACLARASCAATAADTSQRAL